MKISIRDIPLKGKRVLVRVDYNVPLELDKATNSYVVTDQTRILETLDTLKYLIDQDAKIILISHLGRPKGKKNTKESLAPVAPLLSGLLGTKVKFIGDCIGPEVDKEKESLKEGEVLLLENTRFYAGEEKNDPEFAKALASHIDVYVNDAFGSAHRAHASTEGVCHFVKQKAIGFLMEKELKYLGEELKDPQRPFVVILGGAKVSDKIEVINKLLEKADCLLIGGAMAYTFLLTMGHKVGKSLVETDKKAVAQEALEKAKERKVKFLLPIDHLVAESIDFEQKIAKTLEFTAAIDIPEQRLGVDIGPQTMEAYRKEIITAKTLLWNGPMGIFEIPGCEKGTFSIAKSIAENPSAVSIVAGGDSIKALHRSGLSDKVSFISTGGGATLDFLKGKVLPGIESIPDK
ncbi:phosphoglycerate kinase [Methylacidiphilum caldifontis]|uniref:phosphoglycerate kinase n=1 Tax=Methylacidiphilum caldifontis TaxID=2795386 RepID=UPI001A8D4C4C|nr:phosphoglycerate kinase [Methylacidiphilum caldifontis]QSR89006.1 phosphoglycerate kinase [Methylacidiphilum caldifontis]